MSPFKEDFDDLPAARSASRCMAGCYIKDQQNARAQKSSASLQEVAANLERATKMNRDKSVGAGRLIFQGPLGIKGTESEKRPTGGGCQAGAGSQNEAGQDRPGAGPLCAELLLPGHHAHVCQEAGQASLPHTNALTIFKIFQLPYRSIEVSGPQHCTAHGVHSAAASSRLLCSLYTPL